MISPHVSHRELRRKISLFNRRKEKQEKEKMRSHFLISRRERRRKTSIEKKEREKQEKEKMRIAYERKRQTSIKGESYLYELSTRPWVARRSAQQRGSVSEDLTGSIDWSISMESASWCSHDNSFSQEYYSPQVNWKKYGF